MVYGSLVIADRWTALNHPTRAVRVATTCAVVLGIAGLAIYARWWVAALALPLAAIVLINHTFYAFFARHRDVLFAAAAVLPMHLLYYIYSACVFIAGTLVHRCGNSRQRLYACIAAGLYVIAWSLLLLRAHTKHTTLDFAVSDAIGYYAYLPSIVIDHDLRFGNQIENEFRGDVPAEIRDQMEKTGWPVGAARNRFPVGIALSVAPGFLVAHALSVPLFAITGTDAFRPDGYSLLYVALVAANAMAVGVLGMLAADRLLVERFNVSGICAGAAVLTGWLATNYLWFFVREPLLSHMIGSAWIIISVYLAHRVEREARDSTNRPMWWTLPAFVFALSLAAVCRFTNGLVLSFVACAIMVVIARHRQYLKRSLKYLPLVMLALAPLIVQAILMRMMSGQVAQHSVQDLGYAGRERFYWTRPALVLSLISSRRGLLFWTPALIVSLWGLIWQMTRRGGWRDPVLATFIVGAIALWYVNSSWYAWWLGNSLGNRGYVELAGLFVLGFGFAYSWVAQAATARGRRIVIGIVVFGELVNISLISLKLLGRLESHRPLIPWESQVFTGRLERF